MNTKNDGGPAFPTVDANRTEDYGTYGMTLRNYFAAKALQGCMAYYNPNRGDFHTNSQPDEVAKYCYEIADAMLFAGGAA
jgi:hypothetical protein